METAQATQRTLESVILQVIALGSPPHSHDVPEAYKTELSALARLENKSLRQIAQAQKMASEMECYDKLLALNQAGALTDIEHLELTDLRRESELFMLRKAHAAAILKWRESLVAAN